ncbi:MAG: MoaD/ThiS family protein [Candidatus Bathyarchaeia archaeon]|jgi:molybdopterin converting factor small subunit
MGKTLRVRVKVFGAPAMALESRELTLALARNATVEDLLNSIPLDDKNYVYIVREGIRLTTTSKLNDGDEILIVPPIAGG